MKIKIYALMLLIFGMFNAPTVLAQPVRNGDATFDLHYGVGSISRAFVKAVAEEVNGKFNSFGAMGLRFEYMLSDNIGLGFEGNYLKHRAQWQEQYTDFDGQTVTSRAEYSAQRIRFMPRFNYHFGMGDNLDSFVGLSAGYLSLIRNYVYSDPAYVPESVSSAIPLAMRISYGMRYFFTDNLGANLEFGIGGGNMIHFGFSFKL